jgi:hypothetical protein
LFCFFCFWANGEGNCLFIQIEEIVVVGPLKACIRNVDDYYFIVGGEEWVELGLSV